MFIFFIEYNLCVCYNINRKIKGGSVMIKSFFNRIDDFHISYQENRIEHNMTSQHYHNAYEFLLIMDGERYIFFENSMQKLRKGDLLILSPFVPHYTQTPPTLSFERFVLNVTEEYFKDIMTEKEQKDLFSKINTGIIHLDDEGYKKVLDLFNMMYSALAVKHTESKMKLFKMRIACFLQDIGLIAKNNPYDRIAPKKVKNSALIDAIAYINAHSSDNITLDFIAGYAHMSQSNFCLMFKRETGNTFLNYIQLLRCAQAHKLLIGTNMPIGKIAEKTGFTSVQQMERTFKKNYAKSPREMRGIEKR